ncbi:MAG: cytochrome b [Paracoccus sp. (in: a-proteobacteria)]|uniref:cytochrome b n=1 Tax=Paracoccus sp. TaxID=267 RepID=UPI00391AC5B4
MTPPPAYRRPAIWLHWSVALPVLLMIPAGLLMTRDDLSRETQDMLFLFHKNMGVLLVPLIALRIAFRLTHRPPPLPGTLPLWQRRAAGLSHGLLYAGLVIMPLSGIIRVRAGGFPIELLGLSGAGRIMPRSDGLAEWASGLHAVTAMMLIGLLALHLGAALHHGLIRRDGIWQRMWPRRRQ